MARLEFGGDLAASVFAVTGDTLTVPPMGTTVTFWNAPTAGSQYTDLLELDGVTPIPGGVVTLDGAGQFRRFLGPDTVERMWAQAGAGPRRVVGPTAGSYLTNAAGDARYVPLSGADAEYLTPGTAAATYATQATVATKANADQVPTLEEQLVAGRIGSLVAGTEHIMLSAPFALRIDSIQLAATTSIPADAVNFHSIRWRRYKAGVVEEIVRKATIAGAGNEPITAFRDWNYDNLAFGAAQDLAKGDLLTVIVVTAGTPPALNGVTTTVRYHAL